jgi:DNA-3-methyladenine glycosylase II
MLHDTEARASGRAHLSAADPTIRRLLERYGDLWPRRPRNQLQALSLLVLDQQISVHAARAIRLRLEAALERRWSLGALERCSDAELSRCGLSTAKRRTLRAIVAASRDGSLRLRSLSKLPDEAVVQHLVQVPGIGPWTAQMFLIFALGRPDVLAPTDLGLQNAARDLYGLVTRPDAARFEALAHAWRPYRSLASVYLWASLEKGNWKPRAQTC